MTSGSAGQQDLRTYLRILWRWKFLLLAFLVVIPAGAYLLERGKPKIYQSSTLVEPLNLSGGTGPGTPIVNNNLLAIVQLVTTTGVAQSAGALLHPEASAGSLLGEVSASPNVDTGFLTITAQDRDPRRAAAIANAFAAALSNQQTGQAIHGIDAQIVAFRKQLAAIPRSDTVNRASLSQQIATLKALRLSVGAGAQVIQPAVASATPIGSTTRRAVEIAFVIALLLGVGAVLAAEHSDRRLRTPEDLERLTGMPLLGTMAPSAFSPDRRDAVRDDEAFQMLSAALSYFNSDRPLASVAIISPGPSEGKTTVAVGLAVATARAGKRAILVDADLRRPQVCARLGIIATAGLGEVLKGECHPSEVVVEVQVDSADRGHRGRLFVLPAGHPVSNPAALLRSQEMRALVRELEGRADLVIIDTPAALAVSDALALLPTVSGIVMTVRMNQSPRTAVQRLQKVIAAASGTVVGVVATGSVSTGEYGGYGYGYYSAQNGNGRAPRGLFGRRHGRVSPPPGRAVSSNGAARDPRYSPSRHDAARSTAPANAAAREPQPPPNRADAAGTPAQGGSRRRGPGDNRA